MAQRPRPRQVEDTSESLADAAEETTNKVVSEIATGGDAWKEGQAGLLDQVDQTSQRWIESRREAIDTTSGPIGLRT